MSWIVLVVAGLLEVVWAVAMKRSEGVPASPRPSCSRWRSSPVCCSWPAPCATCRWEPATPVWTGIGAIGTALVGVLALGDSAALPRLGAIGLIAAGIVGLALAPGGHEDGLTGR